MLTSRLPLRLKSWIWLNTLKASTKRSSVIKSAEPEPVSGQKTCSRQASLHAPQVRFMAQRAASYGEAVLHKSLTMKHCFATAPQYEASPVFISLRRGKPFHSDMKHFAYAPYDVRKWKMRVYPFAIQRYPHYIMTCNPVLYGCFFCILILPNEWQVLIA